MAAESADCVRRHRAREAGYEGKSCPIAKGDLTAEGIAVTQAWAEGVWRSQAEQSQAVRATRRLAPK